MREIVSHGLAFGGGVIAYWIMAGGRTTPPDALDVFGFVIASVSLVFAWRIYEMQTTSQSSFEASQGEVLSRVQTVLTEIREVARSTQGQVDTQIRPLLETIARSATIDVGDGTLRPLGGLIADYFESRPDPMGDRFVGRVALWVDPPPPHSLPRDRRRLLGPSAPACSRSAAGSVRPEAK